MLQKREFANVRFRPIADIQTPVAGCAIALSFDATLAVKPGASMTGWRRDPSSASQPDR